MRDFATWETTADLHPVSKPLTLLDLPEDILRQILSHLLQAEKVPLAKGLGWAEKRRCFEVAVLRTSKILYNLGLSIFCRNNFILLSAQNDDAIPDMKEMGASVWTDKIKRFKRYHLRLHVAPQSFRLATSTSVHFGLACALDIHKVVNALLVQIYCFQPEFKILISMNASGDGSGDLPAKTQRALLEPLTRLRGDEQKCVISGVVEDSIAANIKNRIVSPVFWFRADMYEYLDVLTYTKGLVEKAIVDGDYAAAHRLCFKHIIWVEKSFETRQCFKNLDYERFEEFFAHHSMSSRVDSELARLLLAISVTDSERQLNLLQLMFKVQHPQLALDSQLRNYEATSQQIHGLARLWLGELTVAHGHFRRASEYDPDNVSISKCLLWSNSLKMQRTKPSKPQLRKHVHNLLTTAAPKVIPVPVTMDAVMSAALDQELYDLKRLGYIGRRHGVPVTQMRGYSIIDGELKDVPFSEAARDQELESVLAQQKDCTKNGKKFPIVKVGQFVRDGRIEHDPFLRATMRRGFRLPDDEVEIPYGAEMNVLGMSIGGIRV